MMIEQEMDPFYPSPIKKERREGHVKDGFDGKKPRDETKVHRIRRVEMKDRTRGYANI